MRSIHLLNRQRKRRLRLDQLQKFAERALAAVAPLAKARPSPDEIFVVFVSDWQIAAIHWKFMNIRGPTDVVTFQHGEIIINVDAAERQAPTFGKTTEQELELYLVHGLLHLCGYDDGTRLESEEMTRLQEQIAMDLSAHGE
ncbi:MAG: rRNA maturation RNase YbeY [Chthoniobacterales bacterium]